MKIETLGDLRSFLASSIEDVAAGRLDVQRASQIHKMAGQITESVYAEVKASALNVQLGRPVAEMGALAIATPAQ